MPPQKKYICAFCARAFSRSEHKQRHERSHTNEKPFHCQYCTSAFVRRDLLQRHCRTVHNINVVPLVTKASKKNVNSTSSPGSPISYEDRSSNPVIENASHSYPQNQIQTINMNSNNSGVVVNVPPSSFISNSTNSTINANSGPRKFIQNLPKSFEQDYSGSTIEEDQPSSLHSTSTSPGRSFKNISGNDKDNNTLTDKKIVHLLSLSKKLNMVFSNFEKIVILQSKDMPKIEYLMSNFNFILPLDLPLSQNIEEYFLVWNMYKSYYPLFDTLESEVVEFIESFSNSSSLSMIGKLFSKLNGHNFGLTCSDSQKILTIECNVCLLYSILALGAFNHNNDDCIILFMKAWNLLITNLIPRLNSNSENFESKSSNTNPNSPSNDIINDQMMILKNLFMLAFVSSQINQKMKNSSCTLNVVNVDIVYNYLDDISYIIMSHLDESYGIMSMNSKSSNQSRSSSSSSLNSQISYNSNLNAEDFPLKDRNLLLFWSIYVLLSRFFLVRNHEPPKIYSYLLKAPITKDRSLIKVMESLSTKSITSLSPFQDELIVVTLSNELQSQLHYKKMYVYELKSIFHNALIFLNQSLNEEIPDTKDFIYKMFKKKMIVNCSSKFRSLLNNYMFIPEKNYVWDLLYLSLKEYNFVNYHIQAADDKMNLNVERPFKFQDFFRIYFEDFECHSGEEVDVDEKYVQFVKYVIPYFSNRKNLTDFEVQQQLFSGGDYSDRNQMIDNNLGIASIPILFTYQCLQVNKLLNKTRSSFDLKRFHHLIMEWYMTMVKLIIGLKHDSSNRSSFVDSNGQQQESTKSHYRTYLNESCHDLNMNQTNTPSNGYKKSSSEDRSLSNNYIFQCLIFIFQQIGSTFELPNGEISSLSKYTQELDFENDSFYINDTIIYLLLKNIDAILAKWIEKINENSNMINSIGFKNLMKFMDSYIYSQLDISKIGEEEKNPANANGNNFILINNNSIGVPIHQTINAPQGTNTKANSINGNGGQMFASRGYVFPPRQHSGSSTGNESDYVLNGSNSNHIKQETSASFEQTYHAFNPQSQQPNGNGNRQFTFQQTQQGLQANSHNFPKRNLILQPLVPSQPPIIGASIILPPLLPPLGAPNAHNEYPLLERSARTITENLEKRMMWNYTPVCIQVYFEEKEKEPLGYSGIYLVLENAGKTDHLFISIGNPTTFLGTQSSPQQPRSGYDISISAPSLVNENQIEWYSAKLETTLRVFNNNNTIDIENDKLFKVLKHLLQSGFKFIPIQEEHVSVDETIINTNILVFDLKHRAQYGEFYKKVQPSLKSITFIDNNIAYSKTKKENKSIVIEGTPFNLTNAAMFMDFVSVGLITFTISNELETSGYLSDITYLENMNGSIVKLTSDNHANVSLGLVAGTIRKMNGDGQLTLIISWERLFKVLLNSLKRFNHKPVQLLNTMSTSLVQNELDWPKRLGKGTQVDPDTKDTTFIIAISIADENDNYLFWGSGIVYNEDTLVTNSHVVNTKAKNNIRILFDENSKIKLNFQGMKAQATMKYDAQSTNYDQILVPFEDIDLAFIKLSLSNKKKLQTFTSDLKISPVISDHSMYTQQLTESRGFGLFLHPTINMQQSKEVLENKDGKSLVPLSSLGNVSSIWRLPLYSDSSTPIACLTISTSSCWNGSSGGGIFSSNGHFLGLISSNAQVRLPKVLNLIHDSEKVTTFSLCIPLEVIDELYKYIMADYFKILNPKIRKMWGLEKTHLDIYIEQNKL